MKIDVTRRDLLRFAGGAAVGVMMTPVPWKAVDDLAIWTQNWRWIPVPPKGPVTMRRTVCSLCPAGCPVEARCVGGLPVSLRAPAPEGGAATALCTLGLTGHHLPYHPARLHRPFRLLHGSEGSRRLPVPVDTVLSASRRAIAAARPDRRVAVLDMRPGRSVSWAWRRLLASLPGGVLIPSPGREGSSLAALEALTGRRAFGIDSGATRTILSFGAPLAEGWGDPSWTARVAGACETKVRLIQVEPVSSPTVQIADRWLAAKPGTETIVALGLGHVLLAERLVPQVPARDFDAYAALVARFSPDFVAQATGVPADAIVLTARELAADGPSIVVAGDAGGTGRFGSVAETAILGLNVLLGSIGRVGGWTERSEIPPPFESEPLAPQEELDAIADGSIGALFIDASEGDWPLPWSMMSRKLAPGAVVIAIAPFCAGTAARADYILPAAAYLETIHEVPTPFDAPVASLRVSAPLLAPRDTGVDPAQLVRAVASSAGAALGDEWASSEALLRARVSRIHAAELGGVTDPSNGSVRRVAEFAGADELWDALIAGAVWRADVVSRPAPELALLGDLPEARWVEATRSRSERMTVVLRASRDVIASAAVSPVLTKLYQESGLRRPAGSAGLNPATARELGLAAETRARLETAGGAIAVTVVLDAGVMPGVVELTAGPQKAALRGGGSGARSALDVMTADADGAWRSTAARLVEA